MTEVGSRTATPASPWTVRASGLWSQALDLFRRGVGSRWLFWIIIALFFCGGAIIALTARDSIYDEFWHKGIIYRYAEQWGPRLPNSVETEGLGDVEFTGSFLFHWLMSYPFRILAAVFGPESFATVATLRLICVAMVTGGLVVWGRALRVIGATPVVTNLTLLFFAGIPVLTFISATINYDNLLFLFVAATMLWQFKLIKNNGAVLNDWLWLAVFGVAACVTKYTFAPVFALLAVYTFARYLMPLVRSFKAGTAVTSWKGVILPAALAVIFIGLAASRYIVNLVTLGTPEPNCEEVATHDYCMTYGVYERNYGFELNAVPTDPSTGDALVLMFNDWLHGVSNTLSWVGVVSSNGQVNTFGGPITQSLIFITLIATLVLAMVLGGVFAGKFRIVIWAAMGVHSLALFVLNYSNYVDYNILYAYAGRYFLPYLPAIIAMAVGGVAALFRKGGNFGQTKAVVLLGIVLLGMTQGAGALTYLAAADPTWFAADSVFTDIAEVLGRFAEKLMVLGK